MTATPAIATSKPPLLWTDNVATGEDGARYGITEVAQYVSAGDGHRGPNVFVTWRQERPGYRYPVGTGLTLEQARALAEQDHAGRLHD
jgi:hypothetical protein